MSGRGAVLLDAGNTLFFERPTRAEIYAQAARARDLDVTDEAMRELMGRAHDALPRIVEGHFRYSEGWFLVFIETVFGGLGFAGDFAGLADELFAAFESRDTFHLFPETRRVVQRLKGARVPLAVVSNWSPRLQRVLGVLGLSGAFDAVLSSAVVRLEKPDPAIFRRAADLLGVPIESCVHVGDHPEKDVDGALSAGARALLLDRTGAFPSHPARIASLDELLAHVGLK